MDWFCECWREGMRGREGDGAVERWFGRAVLLCRLRGVFVLG